MLERSSPPWNPPRRPVRGKSRGGAGPADRAASRWDGAGGRPVETVLGPQPGAQTPRNWSNLSNPHENNRPPNPLTRHNLRYLASTPHSFDGSASISASTANPVAASAMRGFGPFRRPEDQVPPSGVVAARNLHVAASARREAAVWGLLLRVGRLGGVADGRLGSSGGRGHQLGLAGWWTRPRDGSWDEPVCSRPERQPPGVHDLFLRAGHTLIHAVGIPACLASRAF